MATAIGRGPPLTALAAEERFRLEPVTHETPDREFDRRWGLVLLDQALRRLTEEQAAREDGVLFGQLKPFLAAEPEPGDYARIALASGLTPNTVAKRVERLRERFRDLVLAEALQTVGTPAEAEAELRSLFI